MKTPIPANRRFALTMNFPLVKSVSLRPVFTTTKETKIYSMQLQQRWHNTFVKSRVGFSSAATGFARPEATGESAFQLPTSVNETSRFVKFWREFECH